MIKMMFTTYLRNLNKHDAEKAGGKGASLGEMLKVGIPVPGGFVVDSTTFDYFIEHTGLDIQIEAILDTVDHKTISSVEEASESIQSLILSFPIPIEIEQEIYTSFDTEQLVYVAVRSSATAEDGAEHARAGQLDSYLNTTREDLIEKIRKCWASLFTPRAIFYRFEKDLHNDHISVAVVVQKMVQSEVSGIAFSVHPVTEDKNQMIIEAGYGLGEAIVSGVVTPDSYVVRKDTKEIDITVNNQQKALYRAEIGGNEWVQLGEKGKEQILTKEQIVELSIIILRIENYYGFPCDIEWAYEGGIFYIVQSRPITTLKLNDSIISRITLSRIYSREKSLLYFMMRNDSDRMGYKDFLDYHITNNLFIVPKRGIKGSVRYSYDEFDDIEKKIRYVLKEDYNQFVDTIFSRLNSDRNFLLPYLKNDCIIQNTNDFQLYYTTLVHWRSAMNTVFTIPDMDDINTILKEKVLSLRSKSEKYTEKMNMVMVDYFESHYQNYLHISHVVTPQEVIQFDSILKDNNVIKKIESRLEGCFMLNEQIYKLADMDNILKENNIVLENEQIDDVEILSGSIAYPGIVKGRVSIIHGFKDLDKIQSGSILVTEMTNPEYVPVMKKVGAIITNEGGITCHASIASRELQIPCIVGTKCATQILKDGDLVEVDADNGVVKILERKKEDSIGNLDGYIRLFAFHGYVQYVFSDDFMNIYKQYNSKVFCHKDLWLSYMSKKGYENTTDEGLDLYGSKEKYDEFVKKLYDTMKDINSLHEDVLKSILNQELYYKYISLLAVYRQLYAYTEFFYTDKAFLAQDDNLIIKENFATFEQVKLDGRAFLNTLFLVNDAYIYQFIQHIAKQTGIIYQDLLAYSLTEIGNLITKGEKKSDVILQKRKQAYIIYDNGDEMKFIYGDEAYTTIEKNVHQTKQHRLTGQIASKGKVKGKAKVIKVDPNQYDNLKTIVDTMGQGDILVTETTEPSIIAACAKAGAIVTNQGGMMSHAAIVSRELGIPCIVGTGCATEMINDGDWIEVDADNGIISIL